jgi:hypothetical protein
VGVYAYCVVPAGQVAPAGVTGFNGAALSLRPVDRLAIVISEGGRPEPGAEAIRQHNAVVEAFITEEVTPVPLRFGQWADEAEPLVSAVREKAAWYGERLAAFAGALEFGIRVIQPDRPGPARDVRVSPAATGREYMHALRERVAAERASREEIERVRAGIADALAGLVLQEHVEEARTPHGIVTVSHLVARDNFDEYREKTQGLRVRFAEMRFLVSGPWAPYSFAHE